MVNIEAIKREFNRKADEISHLKRKIESKEHEKSRLESEILRIERGIRDLELRTRSLIGKERSYQKAEKRKEREIASMQSQIRKLIRDLDGLRNSILR